ncbi:MAG TPA: hypothetical protein VF226_09595 [Hyphomicrobiaceae bacterium]|jgi:hypothetical protein
MRHALGVIGVLAAGVLLAVSAAMNWRFGYQLGKTEFDGLIYGSASAAADCLKALVPFFFFAAIRNRMWSQAAASALVWVVVTAYSLTSALGHAALNRMDTTGQRAIEAQSYQDLRANLDRAKEQLSWVPQHRPAAVVQSDIDTAKNSREWQWTDGCTKVTGPKGRKFCGDYNGLLAELASAEQAEKLEARIAEIQAQLGTVDSGAVMAEADPQAAVLTKLAGIFDPSLTVEDVQTALTIFIALLLEVGSGFGMYIAFSQWRLYDRTAPAAPVIRPAAQADPAPVASVEVVDNAPVVANDNRSVSKLVPPETDVQRFFKERVVRKANSSVTPPELYEDYLDWCGQLGKEPLAQPIFYRDCLEMGIERHKAGNRTRYMGIALRNLPESWEDKKLPALAPQAA